MSADSTDYVKSHEHVWQDTGFATVEDCAVEGCNALRSGGVVMPADNQPYVELGQS